MSNLWTLEQTGEAASLGSFFIPPAEPRFTPWQDSDPADTAPAAPAAIDAESIQADIFAEGFEAGRRTVELEIAAERDAIARLAETLEVLRPQPTQALAVLIAGAVERLVSQIVGDAPVDAELLRERAEAAAAMIGEDTDAARLRLHPDDVPLLELARIPVARVADPSLPRGSIMLETGEGWIEDGPRVRLERLRAELDRIGSGQ